MSSDFVVFGTKRCIISNCFSNVILTTLTFPRVYFACMGTSFCLSSKTKKSIFCNDIVEQRKFTLISTVNHSENLNNGHYTAHVKNNFSPAWYHCNDAAESSSIRLFIILVFFSFQQGGLTLFLSCLWVLRPKLFPQLFCARGLEILVLPLGVTSLLINPVT